MTKEKNRQRIGQRIVEMRKSVEWTDGKGIRRVGMTQEELAARSGLQRTHISRIEMGKYTVTLDTLQAIAEALGMTVDIIDPRLADLAPLKTL